MTNPIIVLDDAATALQQLKVLLNAKNKAIFMVLGKTQKHWTLAKTAELDAIDFRYVILVTNPALVLSYLNTLPIDADPPVPSSDLWFAICVKFDNTIVEVYTDDDPSNIVPCFLLATS